MLYSDITTHGQVIQIFVMKVTTVPVVQGFYCCMSYGWAYSLLTKYLCRGERS